MRNGRPQELVRMSAIPLYLFLSGFLARAEMEPLYDHLEPRLLVQRHAQRRVLVDVVVAVVGLDGFAFYFIQFGSVLSCLTSVLEFRLSNCACLPTTSNFI